MRVHINAHNRQVEIEVDPTNVSLTDVVALAQATWDRTTGAEPSAPAYGFVSAERQPRPPGPAWFRRDQPEVR